MARFTTEHFIALVEKHAIRYHEKKLGQLFCDGRSQEIITILLKESSEAGVSIAAPCDIAEIRKGDTFIVSTNQGTFEAPSLVIATGGLSISQIGATNFGYNIAEQFGLKVTPLRPGLVPLIVDLDDFKPFKKLSGISIDAEVSCNGARFRENILFTHRGLSGPAVLQISSFWREGDAIAINLLPDVDPVTFLEGQRKNGAEWLEQRGGSRPIPRYSKQQLAELAHSPELPYLVFPSKF